MCSKFIDLNVFLSATAVYCSDDSVMSSDNIEVIQALANYMHMECAPARSP